MQDGLFFRIKWPRRPTVQGQEVAGWTNFSDRALAVSSGLEEPEQAAVLLHEAAHVFFPGLKEQEIERMCRMVVLLAKTNPEAMRWIVERIVPAPSAGATSGGTRRGAGRAGKN